MAENVGQLLSAHASGLSNAVRSLITDAFAADDQSKNLNMERLKEAFKLPPIHVKQHLVYDKPNAKGKLQKRLIKFDFLVPGCILNDGIPLIIKRYWIKSTFEAQIKKHNEVATQTEAHGHVKASGLFHIPSVSFDIAEKVNTKNTGDESQRNTFDVEIELGQGEPAIGYVQLSEAIMKSINRILELILQDGGANAKPLTQNQAKKLSDDWDLPVEDWAGDEDEQDWASEDDAGAADDYVDEDYADDSYDDTDDDYSN